MSDAPWPGVGARTADEAARSAPLGDEARALLAVDPAQAPAPYLDALAAQGLFPDAVRFLAHALSKREAVWWACLCARAVQAGPAAGPVADALAAAERWTAEPDEPNRRSAQAAADAAGVVTPAGCAAIAAFWSGGSLGPPELAAIPPADHLTARGVTGAVLLAAVQTEPEKSPEKFRRFLSLGRDVAAGKNRWGSSSSSTRPPSPSAPGPTQRPAPKATRGTDNWE
jgi:hypothetical protein